MKSWAPTARAAASTSASVGLGPAVGDVVADGPGEQERLLGHVAELAAEGVQVERAQVVAVDAHAALVGVVEAGEQLHHGRLAGAGLADQGDRLAGGDVQVDAAQRLGRLARPVESVDASSRGSAGPRRSGARRPPGPGRPTTAG